MEQISQLKSIRDEALNRLQSNPDYRLLTSLDQLIVDLEMVVSKPRTNFAVIQKDAVTKTQVDDMISKMGSELASAAKEDATDASKGTVQSSRP